MALGFGKSKQKTDSQQQSGLNPTHGQVLGGFIESDITGRLRHDPHGLPIMGAFGDRGLQGLASDLGSNVPLLQLNQDTDLTTAQQNQATSFIDRLAKSMFSKFSAGANLRGQAHVQNLSSLVGSSAENAVLQVLPQTLELAGKNRLFNTTAPILAKIREFEAQTELQKILAGLVTGSSFGKSSGSASAFDFDSGLSAGLQKGP